MIDGIKMFVSLLLVICGMVMVCVGCFHPDVSTDGAFWGYSMLTVRIPDIINKDLKKNDMIF